MTAEHPRPTRPASRWDDGGCGVKGCPCAHNPARGQYPNGPCDRGFVAAGENATTPGVRGSSGARITAGVTAPGAVRRCPTCKSHAESLRKDQTDR
jgi:hypothetical protein